MEEDESGSPSALVEISSLTVLGPLDVDRLRAAVLLTLQRHQCRPASLSITYVDDQQITQLNQQYLDRPGPTDVLSFDLADPDTAGIDGQVVVSVETAQRQAGERGHPLEAELALYTIHGVLHLLGYDDRQEDQARRMHAREDELLTELGYGPVFGKSVT